MKKKEIFDSRDRNALVNIFPRDFFFSFLLLFWYQIHSLNINNESFLLKSKSLLVWYIYIYFFSFEHNTHTLLQILRKCIIMTSELPAPGMVVFLLDFIVVVDTFGEKWLAKNQSLLEIMPFKMYCFCNSKDVLWNGSFWLIYLFIYILFIPILFIYFVACVLKR